MTPDNFARIISAMRPAASRIDAEKILIKAMRNHRDDPSNEDRESLLEASGAFYARYSTYALDHGPQGAYSDLLAAWVDIALAYDKGSKGTDFDEVVFDMYRVVTTHRIHID